MMDFNAGLRQANKKRALIEQPCMNQSVWVTAWLQ